jgi:hypothetical protein
MYDEGSPFLEPPNGRGWLVWAGIPPFVDQYDVMKRHESPATFKHVMVIHQQPTGRLVHKEVAQLKLPLWLWCSTKRQRAVNSLVRHNCAAAFYRAFTIKYFTKPALKCTIDNLQGPIHHSDNAD